MTKDEIIEKTKELEKLLPSEPGKYTDSMLQSFYITTVQFVKTYIGENTIFYENLRQEFSTRSSYAESSRASLARQVLKSIRDYLSLSLEISTSESYSIKLDVISDFLRQAVELANDKKFHPAAAAILLGATLEEFLKKLAEENMIEIKENQTIDPVAKALYSNDIITKQDMKDITSWAGIRNDATHGDFESVNDRKRIQNAIEGVNLFMRKYSTN